MNDESPLKVLADAITEHARNELRRDVKHWMTHIGSNCGLTSCIYIDIDGHSVELRKVLKSLEQHLYDKNVDFRERKAIEDHVATIRKAQTE
jgi:hypothetical protein